MSANQIHHFYVSLGSNKPMAGKSPADLVLGGFSALKALGKMMVLSPLYRADAWPDPEAPAYVNAVAGGLTVLSPEAILAGMLAIEVGFSRVRSNDPALRYAPRTLDLDLISYGDAVLNTDTLTIPHPRLHERAFVLAPLAKIAPNWCHPTLGKSAVSLLDELDDIGRRAVARLPFSGKCLAGDAP
ncbi:MAG: 2-amino-4-hydroxy-6-hydroxymethyldihydropteridine diphosphokinase [Pseudomonadota bacterium]